MSYAFSSISVAVPPVRTKYRRIKTAIPSPSTVKVLNALERYESRSMQGQLPVLWDRAKDFRVYDCDGNCWIDFTSTIFVTNAGHANRLVASAIRKTLDQELLHTYTFPHWTRARFLKKLIDMTPAQFEKGFLLSAGTEASECAIKLMRMRGQEIRKSKIGLVSFRGAMHGRTMGAEMLKGNSDSCAWIGYLDPHIYHLPFPYPWDDARRPLPGDYDWEERFERDIAGLKDAGVDLNDLCGFMIESYLGWGAIFYPEAYMRALAGFARKHDMLIAFDEIQGGFGRTGKLFAYQHYGIEPDLLCLGKALSGSLPLSAVIGSRHVMDLPAAGSMSSTHSANPLSCAAGLANLEYIERHRLVKRSEREGKVLHDRLNRLKDEFPKRISHVLGRGLLAGVIFVDPETGRPDSVFPSKVCERAMQKGLLLVHTGRESIKIGPPLTIPEKALIEGLETLAEAVAEIDRES